MTTFFIEALACDMRRAHALIAGSELGFLGELFQFLRDDCATREEHWKSRTDVFIENKQLQFAAKLAMVALLRFLEHGEIVVEFLFRFERRAINTLQLRILFIAFVVSAGDARQAKCVDVPRAHYVWPRTEIDEVAAAIERDFFVGRDVLDDVELEFARLGSLAQRREPTFFPKGQRFIA
ncbi:MAG: hypothetical protein Udaeo2_31370 [Candidatus Udaeobacter sp.]|nr:MAG: hypothetical protein Udaeo2_31370 [Candidatus Udaeobacter sp.]